MRVLTTMRLTFLFLVGVTLAISGCKTVQPPAPQQSYTMSLPPVPVSTLYVPVHLTRDALESMIQQTLKELKLQTISGKHSGWIWNATLTGKVGLNLNGQQIFSHIPLDIEIFKDVGISTLSAKGTLEVNLRTLYNIRPDWTVQTYTTLESHRWTRKPVARVGMFSIPIGGLADLIIRTSQQQITQMMDEEIQKALDLRVLLTPLWTTLKRPRLISESMQIWFRFEPQVAGIEAFEDHKGTLRSAVHIRGLARVRAGAEPALLNPAAQPEYALVEDHQDSLRIMIHTEIPYDQAERIAEEQLIGQTFSSGKKKVVVEGIDLFGQGTHLIASVRLGGSYKGQVHLRGTPVFNLEKNQIELSEFDFDLQTKNVLLRSAGWLFKGNIRTSLANQLKFPLESNLSKVRDEINTQLGQLQAGPWIRLSTKGLHLTMDDIILTPDGMALNMLLSGLVEVHLAAFE
ncbi:MAG: DUF4403 family protein [Saprospiraceae bacterium]|nr:DUF4403 family protein [Saprospiraceae bacterium]